MTNLFIKGMPCLLLTTMVFATIAATAASAQECPADEAFPYDFCKDGQIVTRCTPDPYHLFEDGKPLKPLKRYVPGCLTIDQGRTFDVYMPTVGTGEPLDSALVYAVNDETRNVDDAFNAWNKLCPESTDEFDCCTHVYFARDGFLANPDSTPGLLETEEVDPRTCRPTCSDSRRISINDTPNWLYGTPRPGPGDSLWRSFYTGRFPPSVASYCRVYSLYQLMEFLAGEWFEMVGGQGTECPHPNRVMESTIEFNTPAVDLTAEDICQFRKLYCDHDVGLGVDDATSDGRIQLSQNVPNPFHTLTTIPFTLKQRSHVVLDVSDERGAVITTLMDEQMESGRHVVGFNGAGLAAGTYWYALHVDGTAVAREMVMTR